MFVDILVDVCVLFKLDGWLLNIENNLTDTSALKEFVKSLTEKLHARRPGSMVIWYDSVIHDGKLKWQNELNELNRYHYVIDIIKFLFLTRNTMSASLYLNNIYLTRKTVII